MDGENLATDGVRGSCGDQQGPGKGRHSLVMGEHHIWTLVASERQGAGGIKKWDPKVGDTQFYKSRYHQQEPQNE